MKKKLSFIEICFFSYLAFVLTISGGAYVIETFRHAECPEGYTCEKIPEPHNWNAYGPSQECLNNQSEVFLESGKPYQFSCNQIRLMIKASAYPSYSNNYTQYCNYGNESHMLGFHGTIYSPPIKYSFVEDYIIRCDGGEG